MKVVTLELPDSVDIVCANYISISILDAWCINSSFKPKDGMRVIVHEAPDKDHIATVEYAEKEDEDAGL